MFETTSSLYALISQSAFSDDVKNTPHNVAYAFTSREEPNNVPQLISRNVKLLSVFFQVIISLNNLRNKISIVVNAV